MDQERIKLEDSWKEALFPEFQSDYMTSLREFVAEELDKKKVVYPSPQLYFNAFEKTPLSRVRVVVLGQDPYPGHGQAHGLSFSVPKGVALPRSLKNIYKEIQASYPESTFDHGCLEGWSQQGVLLLNSVLTVEAGKPGSHQGRGWELFTDAVLKVINGLKEPVVYLLWGAYAQKKGGFLDNPNHLVLTSSHPSPLAAHRGFIGCRHFEKANQFLKSKGMTEIDWSVH